jgi:hypothetical protein
LDSGINIKERSMERKVSSGFWAGRPGRTATGHILTLIRLAAVMACLGVAGPRVAEAASDPQRYAVNKSVGIPTAEEDNVNIPMYGYVNAYRFTATIPAYFPLQQGQVDNCTDDFSGYELHPPFQVFYFDATAGDLMHVHKGLGTLGEWWRSPNLIDSGGANSVGSHVSYANPLSGDGRGHIAYYDATGADLKYLKQTSLLGFGAVETPDSAGNVGQYASIALDAAENPHIAYYDASNGNLKYATKSGASWVVTTIDGSANNVGQYCSLLADAANGLHVAYYDVTTGDLKYMYKASGGAWSAPVTLDSTGNVGQYASLDIGPDGAIHIAYYDATNGNLKYATKPSGGSWSVVTVDGSANNVGLYARLGVNHAGGGNGRIHIAYHDATGGDLKYAYKAPGGSWNVSTLDTAGTVGQGISLRVYQFPNDARHQYFDAVFVTYYDATAGDLKAMIRTESGGWGAPEVAVSAGNVGQYAALNFGEYYPPGPPSPGEIFNNGSTIVSAHNIADWWIQEPMEVQVIGGQTVSGVSMVTITDRLPDQNDYKQILALYSSSHLRPLPYPFTYMNDVCYGNSVLLGNAAESEWPKAPIRKLVVDPMNDAMDAYFYNGGHVRVTWDVSRGSVVYDVTDMSTDSVELPFSTIRAMYVHDQKAVFSEVEGEGLSGLTLKLLPPFNPGDPADAEDGLWTYGTAIYGDWWRFLRNQYTFYNTSNPDLLFEVLSPRGCYVVRQAEQYTAASGTSLVSKDSASGNQSIKSAGGVAEASYNVTPAATITGACVNVRYTDDVGGSLVEVFVNNVKKGQFTTKACGTLNDYLQSGQVSLGTNLGAAVTVSVKLKITPNAGHAELDLLSVEQAHTHEKLQDWDDVWRSGTWWNTSPGSPAQYVVDRVNAEQNHAVRSGELQNSVKVVYNKANGATTFEKQYGAFALQLAPTDFRDNDYLSFWVYNNGSSLKFNIKLEDADGRSFESAWALIEPETKTASADWENLVFDLTRAFQAHNSGQIDMTRITQVMFIVAPGNMTAAGTFWMDDLTLTRANRTAPMETFESDVFGWQPGAPFALSQTTESFHNDGAADSLGQRSLKVTWGTKTASYQNFLYITDHDASAAPAGRVGNYRNFRLDGRNRLEAWFRSTTDNNMPILLVFQANNGQTHNVAQQTYTGAGQWQKLVFKYSQVAAATNLSAVILMPYPGAADGGGTLYIDDMRLTSNQDPVADPQPVTTLEDTSVSMVLGGSDPDGDSLTAMYYSSYYGGPQNGTLSYTNLNVTYRPNTNFFGTDTIRYVLTDGQATSAPATIVVTVQSVNDAPMAMDQSSIIQPNQPRPITLQAMDVDSSPVGFSVASSPAHGSLSGTAPNLLYTPAANYVGPDSFTFRANDGSLQSPLATVQLMVSNALPQPRSLTNTIPQNVARYVPLEATDLNGDVLTYTVMSQPGNGSLAGTPPMVRYTPNAGFVGTDTFTFRANDGYDNGPVGTMTLHVRPGIYVNVANNSGVENGSTASPYNTIQEGVAAAQPSDILVVSNGVYAVAQEILINKPITVWAINGPSVTAIDGQGASRCVHITNVNALVEGFTVKNGYRSSSFQNGAGVLIDYLGTVKDCVVTSNRTTAGSGGGIALNYGGVAQNCLVFGNTACFYGGGVYLYSGGKLLSSLVVSNFTTYGGGGVSTFSGYATHGHVENCTIVNNSVSPSTGWAGGLYADYGGTIRNTIVYSNMAGSALVGRDVRVNDNSMGWVRFYNSCVGEVGPPVYGIVFPWLPGTGNITNNPAFLAPAAMDFRLGAGSPCIDTGSGVSYPVYDLNYTPRAKEGNGGSFSGVDMGCYEVP